MSSSALFPTRLTEEEILGNPDYTTYVVLNIPEHGKAVAFDTIGRTTFKKFILKSYADFYDRGALQTSNFKTVPFVISKTPTTARVVTKSNKRQTPNQTQVPNTNNKKKKLQDQNPNLIHLRPSTSQSQSAQFVQEPTNIQPINNIMEPLLTMEITDDENYYAPSHCKCRYSENYYEKMEFNLCSFS